MRPLFLLATLVIPLSLTTAAAAAPGGSQVRSVERMDGGTRFSFDEVSGSTWYYLWLNKDGSALVKRWYRAAECDCDGSECSVDIAEELDGSEYVVWVRTYGRGGHGPWSPKHVVEISEPELLFVDSLTFRGTDGVSLSLDTSADMPSGLAVSKGSGASAPIVEQGVLPPPGRFLAGVRLCYESTGPNARITELSLHQVDDAAVTSTVLAQDAMVRDSTLPECVELLADDAADPAAGPLRVRVEFGLDGGDSIILLSLAHRQHDLRRGRGGARERVSLECEATDGIAEFEAEYKEKKDGKREFEAEFEVARGQGYDAGDLLDVVVDGVLVGQIRLELDDDELEGELEFETGGGYDDDDDDDDLPFPGNFPDVTTGTTVTIDSLSCDLQYD